MWDAQWLHGAVSATSSGGQQQAAAGSSGHGRAAAGSTCKYVDLALTVHRHSVVGRNARRTVARCQLHQRRHQLELADTFQQLIRNSHFAFGQGRGARKRQRQRQEEVTRHGSTDVGAKDVIIHVPLQYQLTTTTLYKLP